ncbi:MAG: PsbP-related protein, partial [Candidatus Moraniibacteriota bacterium]
MGKNIPTELGVSVIVIVSITIVFFVWKYENIQPDITDSYPSSPIILPSHLPPSSNDAQKIPKEVTGSDMLPTTLWKSYSDEQNGYSIKYPQNWLFDTKDGASFYVKELLTEEGERSSFGKKISENLQK